MRKRLFTIIPIVAMLLLGLTSAIKAQDVRSFNFNHQNDGFQIIEQKSNSININFNISKLDLSSLEYKGEEMHEVGIKGIVIPNDKGMPNVPSLSTMIAIPVGAEANVNVISFEKELIENVNIAPSRGIEPQDAEPQLDYIKNEKVYSKNEFYPKEFVSIGEQTSIRGVDIVVLNVNPVQFNPVTKEVIIYHNIELAIDYKGGNGQFGKDAYRSPYFDPILAQNIINYNSLPKIDYEARFQQWIKDDSDGYEYLIITPNNDAWAPYAKQLADLRTKQGILTKVFRLDEMGVTSTNELKAWFHDAYNNWTIKPVAVCLLADHNNNMSMGIPAEVIPHSYSGSCITDNQYADPDGNLLPDMTFSRLIAQDETELPIFVGKQIEYEVENPNMDSDSYKYPVTALGWQTERWFQLCSEVAGGYFRSIGKEPVRINQIYDGNPDAENIWSSADNTSLVVDYFGPNGLGYITATPGEMGDWNNGSPQQIVDAINSGTFLVQHRDHGLETGWGEPAFRNNHVDQLTNTGKLAFIMSINCLTGKYNLGSDCFAERFMRHTYNGQNAGAVAMLCPTEVSFSFVNDAYVWGVYDQFDPDFMPDYGPFADYEGNWFPAFGNVAGKYFLYQCSWPYNYYDKDITYQMFTAHCDAFLRIYSEVPQEMIVTHQDVQIAGLTTFNITAPENTTIALTKEVDNGEIEIIAVCEATGNAQSIEIPAQVPPTIINVVVTGQNYLRYEREVEVIAADGPYLILDEYVLSNDDTQLDFNETASFDLSFKNVGQDPSSNATVTLVSESEYITVTSPTITFDGLDADETVNIEDAFEIYVSDSVPNNTNNHLFVNIESDGETYQSHINIKAYAPKFKIDNLTITEIEGNNNGFLDPAEQATLTFTIENIGNSKANEIFTSLEIHNSFMQLLSDDASIESLEAGESATVSYDIYVSPGTPIGFLSEYTLNCESGYYNAAKTFYSKVGLIIESFETGDLSQFDWNNTSSFPWQIYNEDAHDGNYCIKSSSIGDNQSSEISLQYEVGNNDSISFFVKVSSENGWDKLFFYIDNQQMGNWSGSVSWSQQKYAVSEGVHTFKWAYTKDSSQSHGSDCAWIDYITLPADKRMAISAGLDFNACADVEFELDGYANNHSSIEWSSDGDGSFSSTSIVNPVYTPGTQDAANGSVTLTLTGTDENGETISDDILVTFMGDPSIQMAENDVVCFNESYHTNADVTDYLSVSWSSNGDGTFNKPNKVNNIYTPGAQDIQNGEVVLTLNVFGCSDIEQSITLSILGETTIEAEDEISACGNAPAALSAVVENAETILWTTNGDGTFADATAAETSYTPGSQDIANGEATLTITADGCSLATKDIKLVIREALTLINIQTENSACPNSIAEIPVEFSGSAPFIVKLEGDDNEYQVLEDNILYLEVSNESASYTLTEVSDANGCYTSLNNTFNVNVINVAIPEKPIGSTIIAKDETPSNVYYTNANETFTSYEWLLEPAEAGTINGNGNEIEIVWNQDFNGDLSLKVRGVTAECAGEYSETLNIFSSMISVNEYKANELTVYPNPADESINVKINNINDNKAKIIIYNVLGEVVYTQEISSSDNSLNTQINLDYLSNGSYLMTISTNDYIWKKHIVIK